MRVDCSDNGSELQADDSQTRVHQEDHT